MNIVSKRFLFSFDEKKVSLEGKFKGFGIGKRWIKDFYMNFSQGVSLFVLKVFPLQLEADAALGQNME